MSLELTHPTAISVGRCDCSEGNEDVVYGGSNTQGEPSPSGVANNLLGPDYRVSTHERSGRGDKTVRYSHDGLYARMI